MKRCATFASVVVLAGAQLACGTRTGLLDASDRSADAGASSDVRVDEAAIDAPRTAACAPTSTLLASETASAQSIVLDGDFVYWNASGASPGVRRVHKEGGLVEDVMMGATVDPFAVTSAGLLFGDSDARLHFFPFDGSGERRVPFGVTAGDEPSIVVDGADVYWATSGDAIVRMSPDTSTHVEYAITSPFAFSLATDAAFVYWADLNNNRIRRAPKGGSHLGDDSGVVTLYESPFPLEVAVDDEWIYWTQDPGHESAPPSEPLFRALKDGSGVVETMIARASAYHVRADGTNVYWGAPGADRFFVLWVSKEAVTSTPRQVGCAHCGSVEFAVDGGCLYYQSDRGIESIRAD